MSLTTIVAGFQTFHAALSGITSAPATMPSQINPASLPMALTFPGEASWNEHAIGMHRQERDMIVRVYVAPIQSGAAVDTGFSTSLTLLQTFGDAYLTDPTVGGVLETIMEIRDTGIDGRLTFGSVEYRGFEFHIQAVEKV